MTDEETTGLDSKNNPDLGVRRMGSDAPMRRKVKNASTIAPHRLERPGAAGAAGARVFRGAPFF